MKKTLLPLLFFILSVFKIYAQAYTLTRGLPKAEIAGIGPDVTLGDDTFSPVLPIGFDFSFYGVTYSQFYIGSNGFISFGSGKAGTFGEALPNISSTNSINFANGDLDCSSGTPLIQYFISGTAPNRILVVNFRNVPKYNNINNLTTAQVHLFEGTSGKIEVHVTNVNSTNPYSPFPRTIGIQNNNNTDFISSSTLNANSNLSIQNEMKKFEYSAPPFIEVNIKGNNMSIASGDVSPSLADHSDFGSIDFSTGNIIWTFTIENTGTSNLWLTGSPAVVNISGPNASDFTLTTIRLSIIPGGSSTTFQITFDPTKVGFKQATISIANNDPDENPYTFAISGLGTTKSTGSPFITRWNLALEGSYSNEVKVLV
jgi:hypothetical protein